MKQAAALGINALALTDLNTTAGHVELECHCRQAGIKPIFGVELEVAGVGLAALLALDNEGYRNLLRLASLPGPAAKEDLTGAKRGLAVLADIQPGRELPAWLEQEFGDSFYIRFELGRDPGLYQTVPAQKLVLCQDVRCLKKESQLTLEVLGRIKGTEYVVPPYPMLGWEELCTRSQLPNEAAENALSLAERCNVELPREQRLPAHPDSPRLEELVWQGARERFGEVSSAVRERLTEELAVIRELGYADYFLIVADIVRFAKESGIPVGPGRGSAASSLTAYCLGITEVDSLEWGLLFERFLNAERNKKPDIDLDFCYERRGEVLAFVAERFGSEHVAQIGTYGTFGPKAAAQEVKRVLGREDPAVIQEIRGLKRHRATHAAGVIITAGPIQEISAVYQDRDIPVSHLDMYALESLGALKIDLLGLRTLTLLKSIEDQVRNDNPGFSFDKIPGHDEKTLNMLGEGRTLGIFQLESELFRELLTKLRPRSFRDLAALLALGRPGPLSMFPEYVQRRDRPEKIKYAHPVLKEILQETCGLILYQEQVMLIASKVAGFSLGEADLLRSVLAKNDPKAIGPWKERFTAGAQRVSGLSKSAAEKLFAEVSRFSGYAFNKAHSVSYARITWQAAYLKAHYPGLFFVTLLNQGGKAREELLADAQSFGVRILPPSVLHSDVYATLENGGLRLGLATSRYLTPAGVQKIAAGTRRWTSLKGLRQATGLDAGTLEKLVLCGALDDVGSRNKHLEELGLEPRSELELLRLEKELLGVYASSHPCSPFLPLVRNLQGELEAAAGEILEVKGGGSRLQVLLDTPEGILLRTGPRTAFKGVRLAAGERAAFFGSPEVEWTLPLGPTLLITPKPDELEAVRAALEEQSGTKPTILLLGDAYHLLPPEFWVKDAGAVSRELEAGQIVYTWLDPWKENVL